MSKESYKACLLREQFGSGRLWEKDPPIAFVGRRSQRGFGFWGNLARTAGEIALPALKRLGTRALRSAADLGGDILSGESPKQAFRKRGRQLIKGTIDEELGNLAKKSKVLPKKRQKTRKWISARTARK